MPDRSCLAIVLAAGEGTRMRSSLPKALQPIGGRTLLAHVLAAARAAGCGKTPSWSGPITTRLRRWRASWSPDAQALRAARTARHRACRAGGAPGDCEGADDILVMFADTPLVRPQTLTQLRDALARGAAVAVLGFRAADPTGYGRLLTRGDELIAIREDSDATLGRAQDRLLQWRPDGACRAHALAILDAHRQCKCQGRILSHRCGCRGPRYGLEGGRDRNRGGRRARHQHQGAARRSRGRAAAAAARRRHARPASP